MFVLRADVAKLWLGSGNRANAFLPVQPAQTAEKWRPVSKGYAGVVCPVLC